MATYNASAYNDNHTLLAKIQNIEDYLEKKAECGDGLSTYIVATIEERRRNFSDAIRLYTEASSLCPELSDDCREGLERVQIFKNTFKSWI